MINWPPGRTADRIPEIVHPINKGEDMSKIEVDYVEPAPAGDHSFRVDSVEERESEFGPRLVLRGEIEKHGYPCSLWIPKPDKLSNPKTYLAQIYAKSDINWKELETVDPTVDLPGSKLDVILSYTEEGYSRLKFLSD